MSSQAPASSSAVPFGTPDLTEAEVRAILPKLNWSRRGYAADRFDVVRLAKDVRAFLQGKYATPVPRIEQVANFAFIHNTHVVVCFEAHADVVTVLVFCVPKKQAAETTAAALITGGAIAVVGFALGTLVSALIGSASDLRDERVLEMNAGIAAGSGTMGAIQTAMEINAEEKRRVKGVEAEVMAYIDNCVLRGT